MKIRIALVLSLSLAIFISPSIAGEETIELPDHSRRPQLDVMGFAAQVGFDKITLDRVLEVWGVSWNNAMAKYRRGEISVEQCDEILQKNWSEALDAVVRDELFYQEAKRKEDKLFENAVQGELKRRESGRTVGQPPPNRRLVEAEIRSVMDRRMEHVLSKIVDGEIRRAGGAAAMKRMLRMRGLTWEEYRARLKRKLLTNTFMQSAIAPYMARSSRPGESTRPVDIRNYYKDHRSEFKKPGKVVFRHILFSYEARGGEDAARLAAADVFEAIQDKRITFEEAAAKHSDDPVSKQREGLEGSISRDPRREVWLIDLREAVRKEKPESLGPILVTNTGCHLVKLVKAYPDEDIPWVDASKMIVSRIERAKMDSARKKYYKDLREKINVQILYPTFPQQLSCRKINDKKELLPFHRIGPGALPEAYSARSDYRKNKAEKSQQKAAISPKLHDEDAVEIFIREPDGEVYLARKISDWKVIYIANSEEEQQKKYAFPVDGIYKIIRDDAQKVFGSVVPDTTYNIAGFGKRIILLRIRKKFGRENKFTAAASAEALDAPPELSRLIHNLMRVGAAPTLNNK